ncbi:uncharacterized protein PHACADRAFT_90910 [Phanerochaete carnosa HHB-10118-sp]|uniref:Xylanolytic transcriptional activator regulatory domain-containing protein n=1 Tax=Phanerochaete carnosa (strain HHB-10118-sp) TaxID=650164 RepID=K5V7G7_PHACS|nr:uncharacterized protein PHACADRAFT_90910 [Phanerochaete carnosa HHB-10118-sp]EKM58716.1 hypothetical protein PHACADRAFT_90910 [Phanerochaete carnosa HHB-10118-sp]
MLLNAHGIPTDTAEVSRPSTRPPTPTRPSSTALSPDPEAFVADEEKDETTELIKSFKGMGLHREDVNHIGRSSNLTLIRTAIDVKQDFVLNSQKAAVVNLKAPVLTFRRPEFWATRTALMKELVAKYFEFRQPLSPLLHRPTFEQGIQSGLHLHNEGFGATVLLVCALGAKFSDDPVGMSPGARDSHWVGWRWFEQVRAKRRHISLTAATLYDLQTAYLAAAYIGGSAMPFTNLALLGHALRLAQDMGLHRKNTYSATPTVDGELRKRAFWSLLSMEYGMCMVMGRPCSLQDDDFDVDYPVECDDEYWVNDDPKLAFKQPEGKPSSVTYFIWTLRQTRIAGSILRSLYSLRAPKVLADADRAQHIVSELDSELNKLVDSIPTHLKLDSDQSDPIFAGQSILLYTSSHLLRIMIHRPFIPLLRKPSSLPIPSFTICTNAARACAQLLHRHHQRFGAEYALPAAQLILLTSAIILLLNIWGGKRAGSAVDTAREMEEVDKVLNMFKAMETRHISAGRLWDILHDLKTVVDEPVQQQARMQKRRREEDTGTANDSSADAGTNVQPPRKKLYERGTLAPSAFASMSSSASLDVGPDVPIPGGAPADSPTGPDIDFSLFWQSLGIQPGAGDQGAIFPTSADASAMLADPDLESLFAGLLPAPSVYDDQLAGLSQDATVHSDLFAPSAMSGSFFTQSGTFADPGPSSAVHQGADRPFAHGPEPMWETEQGDIS